MGLGVNAELIWGVPVVAYDDEGWDDERDGYPVTPFWDLEREDWREFEGEIYVRGFGHYEDDVPRGILTSSRVEPYRGDCWEPKLISPHYLDTAATNDKLYSKSEDQARYNKLPVSFYQDAGWWLVAGYG